MAISARCSKLALTFLPIYALLLASGRFGSGRASFPGHLFPFFFPFFGMILGIMAERTFVTFRAILLAEVEPAGSGLVILLATLLSFAFTTSFGLCR